MMSLEVYVSIVLLYLIQGAVNAIERAVNTVKVVVGLY